MLTNVRTAPSALFNVPLMRFHACLLAPWLWLFLITRLLRQQPLRGHARYDGLGLQRRLRRRLDQEMRRLLPTISLQVRRRHTHHHNHQDDDDHNNDHGLQDDHSSRFDIFRRVRRVLLGLGHDAYVDRVLDLGVYHHQRAVRVDVRRDGVRVCRNG